VRRASADSVHGGCSRRRPLVISRVHHCSRNGIYRRRASGAAVGGLQYKSVSSHPPFRVSRVSLGRSVVTVPDSARGISRQWKFRNITGYFGYYPRGSDLRAGIKKSFHDRAEISSIFTRHIINSISTLLVCSRFRAKFVLSSDSEILNETHDISLRIGGQSYLALITR
jgi:hypothetical protein